VVILVDSAEVAGLVAGYVARAGMISSPCTLSVVIIRTIDALRHSAKNRSNFHAKTVEMHPLHHIMLVAPHRKRCLSKLPSLVLRRL
jgi:hypothetical protein